MPNVREMGIEGLTLIFHAIISLVIVLSYVWLKAQGHDDDTLAFAVAGVIGYWFGATGKAVLNRKSKDDKS